MFLSTTNIFNSNINYLISALNVTNIKDSNVSNIAVGYMYSPNTIVNYYTNHVTEVKRGRVTADSNEITSDRELINFMNNYNMLELITNEDILFDYNLKDSNNVINIYQDKDKRIKEKTNIREYESEFINTYENSEGYDDIKDLPIEWKSNDESIAKIENGTIVPLKTGKVDLVGTRGNDIYTIHLTVEKETIPEKIDKMTIKVPITGSKIKAWVVVVSVVLIAVIGVCTSILIKRKK